MTILGKSGRLLYWVMIELCTKSRQLKYILACCHWYWYRFVRHTYSEQLSSSFKMLRVNFHVINHVWIASTKSTLCNFGWISLHSAIIWASASNSILATFRSQPKFSSNWVKNQLHFQFILPILHILRLWQVVFQPNDQVQWDNSWLHVKKDLCGNHMRKQNVMMSSQWAIWSWWVYS